MTQETMQFAQVPIRTLHEHVLEAVRKAIIFGQLPAGHRLMEEDIAAQMGVSRAPVREALRLLEQEGLVVSYPHRGKVVATIGDEELSLLFMVRAELEGFALQSIMQRGSAAELVEELQQANGRMLRYIEKQDFVEAYQEDRVFHSLIISRSGYRALQRVWSSLDGPSRTRSFAVTNLFGDKGPRTAQKGHQRIIDAIASGDCELSVATIRRCIMENLDWATLARLGVLDLSVCRFLTPQALE